jgi:hypothetical protein
MSGTSGTLIDRQRRSGHYLLPPVRRFDLDQPLSALGLSRGGDNISASNVPVARIDQMHATASHAGNAFVSAGIIRCWRVDGALHFVPSRRAAI